MEPEKLNESCKSETESPEERERRLSIVEKRLEEARKRIFENGGLDGSGFDKFYSTHRSNK